MDTIEQPFDVDVEHLLPLIGVLFVHLPQQHHPSIVDQRIGRAIEAFSFLHSRDKGPAVTDIHGTAQTVRQGQGLHSFQASGQQQ
ncbi:hypothetical protein D3C84_627270 [compost metagenome]